MAERRPKQVKVKAKRNASNISLNPHKLGETLKKQWIVKSIELFKEGYSSVYVREFLRKHKTGSRSESAIDTVVKEASLIIVSTHFTKASEIIPIHVIKYNQQIERLKNIKDADDLPEEQRDKMDSETYYKLQERKVKAYNDCINTLTQKETLLQYHNESFVLEINDEEEIIIREVEPVVNVSKLSFEEQLELYSYMKLTRQDESDLLGVIQGAREEKGVTEDIEHEVVETPNIEGIKKIELPSPPYRSPITASDPTIKLRESLQKLAAKTFVEIGGNLTDDEKKLLNE